MTEENRMSDVKGMGGRGRIPDPCLDVSFALSSLSLHKRRQVVQPPLWVSIPFSPYPGTLNRSPAEMGQWRDRFWGGYVILVWAVGQQTLHCARRYFKESTCHFCIARDLQDASDYCGELLPSLGYRRELLIPWKVRRNLLGSFMPLLCSSASI